MATFDPDPELFRNQVESIRAQTIDDWICVISDDCTPPPAFERMRAVLDGDRRFVLTRAGRRLGFYKNFERALALVPSSTPYVALADQDDRWYPEKLRRFSIRWATPSWSTATSASSTPAGRWSRRGYWTDQRRNNYTNLASLLIANTVTGAASLFRGELLDVALPFPEPPGDQFHDHWLGLVALSTGRIAYVDRPLYDYVQHEGAALGHVAANVGVGRGVFVRRLLRGQWTGLVSGWRAAYFLAYCRLRLLAEVLLMRCDDVMSRRSRRGCAASLAASALRWGSRGSPGAARDAGSGRPRPSASSACSCREYCGATSSRPWSWAAGARSGGSVRRELPARKQRRGSSVSEPLSVYTPPTPKWRRRSKPIRTKTTPAGGATR